VSAALDEDRGTDEISQPVRTGNRGEFCANCIGDLSAAPVHEEPIGRGGGIVRLCSKCATEPVRERDSLFNHPGGGAGFPLRHSSGKKPIL
jgi:hypothetical protein